MKVSLNWLKDYVDIRMEVKDLVDLLTMAGLEVEEAVSTGEGFEKVIVAEIGSIRKHPNADRLSLVEAEHREGAVFRSSAVRPISGKARRFLWPSSEPGSPTGSKSRDRRSEGRPPKGCSARRSSSGLGQDATGIMILPPEAPWE